jgi:flagellar hook-length control protein FliK
MMHQLEVNVEIGSEAKKGAKGQEKNAQVAAGKFLTASKLRESFTLNFESLFLDMFTEVPVAKGERIEAARPVERIEAPRPVERAESPRPVEARPAETPRVVEEARAAEVRPVDSNQTKADEKPADDATGREARQDASRAEKPRRHDEENGREAYAETVTHLKALKVELSVKLQEALGAEKLEALGKKIEKLLADDEIDVESLLASVVQIVAEIVGPAEAEEVFDGTAEMNARDLAKLLKKMLRELANAMETGPKVESAAVTHEEVPKAIEEKADEILARLLRKMDQKVTKEDREIARKMEKSEIEAPTPRETRDDRPVEAPKVVALKREAVRQETPKEAEARIVEENRPRRVETGLEAVIAEAARAKARPAPSSGPAPVVVTGVAEAARTARSSEGNQNLFWQNSYNQSASQKGTETARSQRGQEAPRPQQSQVFDQIVQQAKFQIAGGKSEATIRLQPEFLGKVEMKITVEDGKVNVRFTAENAVVRSMMTENMQDLKKNLAEIGLEVEEISVFLAGEFDGAETRDEESEENGENQRAFGTYAEEEAEESFEDIRSIIEDGSTVRYVA